MNTYIQNVAIPIYISLKYDNYFLKFPINPESLRKDIPSNSTTEEIEGIGQISVPKKPNLARITIESFFWQEVNLTPSFMYVTWLERWQKSGKPATLIVTRLNYSMQVTCENFSHWINAGEEEDIYFSLEMQEYRPHRAKKLKSEDNLTLLQKITDIVETNVPPILVDIPKPTRMSINKKSFTTPYVLGELETLSSITKKITSSTTDWKMLYDENKEILGDVFEQSIKIPSGTELKLPDSWINNSSYNIIRSTT